MATGPPGPALSAHAAAATRRLDSETARARRANRVMAMAVPGHTRPPRAPFPRVDIVSAKQLSQSIVNDPKLWAS